MVFQPRDLRDAREDDDIIRKPSEYERGHELILVSIIRESVRR